MICPTARGNGLVLTIAGNLAPKVAAVSRVAIVEKAPCIPRLIAMMNGATATHIGRKGDVAEIQGCLKSARNRVDFAMEMNSTPP